MENKNNNNASWHQLKPEEKEKLNVDYRKMIATADKITDDYNDDPDNRPVLVLLAIGVFLCRMESSLTDKDAIRENGKPCGDQTLGSIEELTYASMLNVIQKGYEIEKIREVQIPEELEKTFEDNGK